MSKRRRAVFIFASLALWGLLGFTLWSLLDTLQFGCKFQEQNSGLWAECFAPVALVYTALFAVAFLVDLARTLTILWRSKSNKEQS